MVDKMLLDFDKVMQKNNEIYKSLKSTKACDRFCKNYVVKVNRLEKKVAKSHGYTYKKNNKKMENVIYKGCRRDYCNKDCAGFWNSIKEVPIKNGFHKRYTKKKIQSLKNQGALSGCIFDNYIV